MRAALSVTHKFLYLAQAALSASLFAPKVALASSWLDQSLLAALLNIKTF
jgi:hypothetical protein